MQARPLEIRERNQYAIKNNTSRESTKEKTLTRSCPTCLYHNLEEPNINTVVRIIKNGNSVKWMFSCVAIKKGSVVLILNAFLIGEHVLNGE